MAYSIGEVSLMTDIPVSTLRYYDREGLLPNMERTGGGTRVFSDAELETLRIIECLKMTDMPLKDIKQFLDWCQEGDGTLQQRRAMFYERRRVMRQKMDELQKTLDTIRYKCWYYDTAVEAGSAEAPKAMPFEDMPDFIQKYVSETMMPKRAR